MKSPGPPFAWQPISEMNARTILWWDIGFADSGKGWLGLRYPTNVDVFGQSDVVFETLDGGATWSESDGFRKDIPGGNVQDIEVFDDGYVNVLMESSLKVSRNYGDSWVEIPVPGNMWAVHFSSAGGWIGGADRIMRWIEEESGWIEERIATSSPLPGTVASDLCFAGDTGWAVGQDGLVLRYQDDASTAVSDTEAGPPHGLSLTVYPNPLNASTRITISVHDPVIASLHIYNVAGQLVRTILAHEAISPGVTRLTWEGLNDHGSPVSSGVYLLRFSAAGQQLHTRVVLAR